MTSEKTDNYNQKLVGDWRECFEARTSELKEYGDTFVNRLIYVCENDLIHDQDPPLYNRKLREFAYKELNKRAYKDLRNV